MTCQWRKGANPSCVLVVMFSCTFFSFVSFFIIPLFLFFQFVSLFVSLTKKSRKFKNLRIVFVVKFFWREVWKNLYFKCFFVIWIRNNIMITKGSGFREKSYYNQQLNYLGTSEEIIVFKQETGMAATDPCCTTGKP